MMIGALVQGVMADSRSPIVGLAIGTAVYLVWKYRAKGLIGIVVLCAFYYVAAHAIPGRTIMSIAATSRASQAGRSHGDFAVSKVKERPLIGYGYEVEGQILSSQYFPGWDAVWSLGYQSSLHDGYVSRAVSLGIPALLFWLFITLRPTISCFLRDGDPWKLRSMVPLTILPVLILGFHRIGCGFPLIRRPYAGSRMGDARARETFRARTSRPARESRRGVEDTSRPSSARGACLVRLKSRLRSG